MESNTVEPNIVMNGHELTTAQAMTVRVALEAFGAQLADEAPLGTDEHGETLTKLYRARLAQIRAVMYR